MSCTPSQVMSPCSDDAVCVAQALGTSGDVAYDEDGIVNLTAGQTEVAVVFTYEKATAEYAFEYLYIASSGVIADDIRAVDNVRTKTGFTVQLSGAPVGTNDILHWRVNVPDSLHVCEPALSTPHYAIVRPSQQGLTDMVQDQDFIQVTFPTAQADNDWGFTVRDIEHLTDPFTSAQVFGVTVSVHTEAGFRLELSGTPGDAFYKLRWRVS